MFNEEACVCIMCKFGDSTIVSCGGEDLLVTFMLVDYCHLKLLPPLLPYPHGHLPIHRMDFCLQMRILGLKRKSICEVVIVEVEVSSTLVNFTTLDACLSKLQ